MPASVKSQIRQELENLAYQVQNWQTISQNVMQQKQAQMYQPIYKKVSDAINAVAKEKGYGYVLTSEALIVAPPADDLLPAVAAKLGIKLRPAATKLDHGPFAVSLLEWQLFEATPSIQRCLFGLRR